MPAVTVVRPYAHKIRNQVFPLLHKAGLHIAEHDIIAPKVSDDEVIDILRQRHPTVLLVPFHAHVDERGQYVNGIDLLERLQTELPKLIGVPVIMPTSSMGLSTVNLRLSAHAPHPLSNELRDSIFVLDEKRLADPELIHAVREHVDARL